MNVVFKKDDQKRIVSEALELVYRIIGEDISLMNVLIRKYIRNENFEDIGFDGIVFSNTDRNLKKTVEDFRNENWNAFEDLRTLKAALDTFIRLCIGQWETVSYLTDVNDMQLFKEKRSLIPVFGDFTDSMSLGIHSDKISNDVRVVYDFYKVLMFESGEGGVYGYEPYPISGFDLPEISFELEPVDTSDIEALVEKYSGNSDATGRYRKIICEDGKYWLPTKEYYSHLLKKGDTVFRKKNGYFLFQEQN